METARNKRGNLAAIAFESLWHPVEALSRSGVALRDWGKVMPTRATLQLRLLGDMEVRRDGEALALPRSKKTRALLAYLAASGRAHRRESLCLVFWDIPDDPRGSLRWSLSKLRPIVDEPDQVRIAADRDSVRFTATGAEVDFVDLRRTLAQGLDGAGRDELIALAETFRGEFLEGLDLPNCPDFQAWLVAQRDEARRLRAKVLRTLLAQLAQDPDAALPHARTLVQFERHDEIAWIDLVRWLALSGRSLEAEQQFEAGCEALGELGPDRDRALVLAWRRIATGESTAHSHRTEEISEPVPAEPVAPPVETPAEPEGFTAPPLPEKPSIAVLPFENASGDPADLYLANGIAADVIEHLGHNPRLFVISRGSTFTLRDTPADHGAVPKRLGVRHILDGSMRHEGTQLHATARLCDGTRGQVLWSQDFKCPIDGVFTLERDLADAVTRAIDPGASQVPDLTYDLPHPKVEAWCLFQRGTLKLYERSETDLTQALELFREAIDLDPKFARAQAASVDAMYYQLALDYLELSADWREGAMQIAQQAMDTAPQHASVRCALGQAHLIMRQHESAIPAFEAAAELNPSFAWAHYGVGAAKVLSGNAKEAMPHLEKAIRLSPIDRNMGSFLLRTADAFLLTRQYEEAVVWAQRALRQPLYQWSRHAVLLSALGHLGRSDEAREILDEVLDRRPDFSLEMVRSTHLYTDQVKLEFVSEPQMFVDQDQFAHYLDGLRKAGVPSG